jgi:hypothetical protein
MAEIGKLRYEREVLEKAWPALTAKPLDERSLMSFVSSLATVRDRACRLERMLDAMS